MGLDAMILVFWLLSFKPAFSLSSFTFIKKLFSSSSLSAIRVVSSAYLSAGSRWGIPLVTKVMRKEARQTQRLSCPWDSPGKNTGVGCHFLLPCMKGKSESEVAQSCPTFCDPMDCSLPGSSVHGIFQARILEWGATAFSADPQRFNQISQITNSKW